MHKFYLICGMVTLIGIAMMHVAHKQQMQEAVNENSRLRYRVIEQYGLIRTQQQQLNDCMGLSYTERDRDGGL